MLPNIEELLKQMYNSKASDLHIGGGSPIILRIHSRLVPITDNILTADEAKTLIYSFLSKDQISRFENDLELDFSFGFKNMARFRVNVFRQRSSVGSAIRLIAYEKMSFEECGLPVSVVKDLCSKPKGLVLITGATGSGKSTTLASMIDYINNHRTCHVVTIEDPIEFVHKNNKSVIDQREVYSDTKSFAESLKHVLRQDPDVIMIGEMRDLETINSALTIAETGHLVFATLHTSDCVQSINRIVDVFPAHQQQQIRLQLSFVLCGILSQQLIPTVKEDGRALAVEVLIATPAVRSLAREGKVHQIYSVIQTSQKDGMKTMNQALLELYNAGKITYDEAVLHTSSPEEFDKLVGKK